MPVDISPCWDAFQYTAVDSRFPSTAKPFLDGLGANDAQKLLDVFMAYF